ncbi:MAG: L-rhamnose mutarotase [Aggregatilineales bacterium]
MKRVGFILKVRQEKIPEYKKHHEAVWPEMQEALRRAGWHNYSLFIRDDGLVFGYFEAAESLQASLDGMAKESINLKWQEFMAPFFERLGGSRPDETMLELQEYFHVD